MSARVEIRGLREFQRALRDIDRDAPKALRVALNQATDLVVTETRARVPSRSGRARGSVLARSTQRAARIAAGGRRAPYYPWLDFGGRVGPQRAVRRPWRKDGRYLYPTYHANKDRYQAMLEEALTDVARSAGVEVT